MLNKYTSRQPLSHKYSGSESMFSVCKTDVECFEYHGMFICIVLTDY